VKPAREPWDARLVAWMSRGSDKAGSGGTAWTPRQRVVYLVGVAALPVSSAALSRRGALPWWYIGLFGVWGVIWIGLPALRPRTRRWRRGEDDER
jgi:hypothetical protein